MRLLWYSNAPWANTGYGTQTAQAVSRIKADGHDIAIAANYGLEAAGSTWQGVPVYPKGFDAHSRDSIIPSAKQWLGTGDGWILTLYDVWPLLAVPEHAQARIASWTPVDHFPVPPQVRQWAQQHHTIAMTEFGRDALAKVGIEARYVPHAINTTTFAPVVTDFRKAAGIPEDAFLVTINAANKGGTPVRKAWSEMLSAFAMFAKDRSDAFLYLHTYIDGIGEAPRLVHLLEALDLGPDKVRVVDQDEYVAGRVNDATLAAIYSASDVLLSTSMGEGFGIPVIEAQACGTPVIVTDFSASKELCGAGWTVGYQPWWDHFQGAWVATPLIAQIVKALHEAHDARGDAALRGRARAFALQYDADTIYASHWRPVLAEMEDMLKPKVRRAERRANARKKGKRAA